MQNNWISQDYRRKTSNILVEPFSPEDQFAVKTLILDGLVEHWGWLDPLKNPDLEDIASFYRASIFLVARQAGKIIGSGALVPRSEDTAEIKRMSVASTHRRQGVGTLILNCLFDVARKAGIKRIVLETTSEWFEAIAFYINAGFDISHYKDGDVYFSMELNSLDDSVRYP